MSKIDSSADADAIRFRWIIAGNIGFLQKTMVEKIHNGTLSWVEDEKLDGFRQAIDTEMEREEWAKEIWSTVNSR